MIALDIVRAAGPWDDIADLDGLLERSAGAALAEDPDADPARGEVGATLLLTDDASVRALNRQWRGQDKATNVLSFPNDAPAPPGEPRHLGDIALAYETLAREAGQEGKTLADHAAHLVVHGILHLLGRDHGADDEADAMEAVEIRALARLGIADPYDRPAT